MTSSGIFKPFFLIFFFFLFVPSSFTLRGALFGATIFGSSELGLWKDGETSREVAKIIIAILTPIANKAKSQVPEQVNERFN